MLCVPIESIGVMLGWHRVAGLHLEAAWLQEVVLLLSAVLISLSTNQLQLFGSQHQVI